MLCFLLPTFIIEGKAEFWLGISEKDARFSHLKFIIPPKFYLMSDPV